MLLAYEGHNTTMAAQSEEERTRTNTFHLAPREDWKRVCLIELLGLSRHRRVMAFVGQ